MHILATVIAGQGLDRPDGRPLHRYLCSSATYTALTTALRDWLRTAQSLDGVGAAFVMWATERIRTHYEGGPLSWQMVFDGVGLRADDTLARDLVDRGMRWWRRPVRISEGGHHMRLYSLLAEGGLPDPMLRQANRYQRVVRGLLMAIECAGLSQAAVVPNALLARALGDLPQALRNEDIARLLGELASSLARLRALVPDEVPADAIDRWLDTHRPGWIEELPLRLSAETAEALVRDTLRSERERSEALPLGTRLLRRDLQGHWHGYTRLSERSHLDAQRLPASAQGRRMRLLPTGVYVEAAGPLAFAATPEQEGWSVDRMGARGPAILAMAPTAPLVLSAYSDGAHLGDVEAVAATMPADEEPTFWVPVGTDEAGDPCELELLVTEGQTRAPRLAVLLGGDEMPAASAGLLLGPSARAPGGRIWWVEGAGELAVGGHCFAIRTGEALTEPDARIYVAGEVLRGWRVAPGGGLVLSGSPQIYAAQGSQPATAVHAHHLHWVKARALFTHRVEWVIANATRAWLRAVVLPHAAQLVLREVEQNKLGLNVSGLGACLRLELAAAGAMTCVQLHGGDDSLELTVPGRPPGQVTLRLVDPSTLRELTLIAPWPAQRGLVLTPDGERLERNAPLAVEDLYGWRGIVPGQSRGDLQLRLIEDRIGLAVNGEVALGAYLPYVRGLLAHAGPDGEIRLRLVVNGHEGHRLEVRRYQETAVVRDGYLIVGQPRDVRASQVDPAATVTMVPGRLKVHAVDLGIADTAEHAAAVRSFEVEVHGAVDLREHLPDSSGPWLLQARFNGRTQRPALWRPQPSTESTREQRTAHLADKWRLLLEAPLDPEWRRQAWLIREVAGGGDMGALDQVQALAHVPAAAVALLLRARREDLAELVSLDLTAPLFWPALHIEAFRQALLSDRCWREAGYAQLLPADQARQAAHHAQLRPIGNILQVRPELRGHFAAALEDLGMRPPAAIDPVTDIAKPLAEAQPLAHWIKSAQAAARRFEQLPSGLPRGVTCQTRPTGLAFGEQVQPLIDGVLEIGEHTVGFRDAPEPRTLQRYLTLRQVDPVYFDEALPFAVMYLRTLRCTRT